MADHGLQELAQQLWEADGGNRVPHSHLKIAVQGGKKSYDTGDAAKEPLFSFVSDEVWKRPTYGGLLKLLDNYVKETGVAESETADERKEISDFLDAILATKPMQLCHRFLVSRGLAKPDVLGFKNELYRMWFSFYRRDGQADSSGFEHVFVGESDENDVSGLHSWIQFYLQEKKGTLDYRGFIKPRSRNEVVDGEDRLLSVQFVWEGELKPVTTIFVGTSPEFEFALYTACFLAGSERNNLELDGYEVCVRAYRIAGSKVGTVFPELMGESSAHHS